MRAADKHAEHVREHGRQTEPDVVIPAFARDRGSVVVSEGTDFGELVARERLLRVGNVPLVPTSRGVRVDKVTDSFLSEFVESHNLESLDRSKQFEAFASYCVISNEYDEEFDPGDTRTGDGADLGIDAAALIVNGDLIQHIEEIEDLKSRNNYLQARIILIQAKTSSEFSATVISDLADNLLDFFCRAVKATDE